MAPTWDEIWRTRKVEITATPGLEDLLKANGHDSRFSGMTAEAWTRHVRRVGERVALAAGASVFDVGCGAGAFLADFQDRGHPVGGIDISEPLVRLARIALPAGSFEVMPAIDLPPRPTFGLVVSSGAFLYFPSLAYASEVIRRMADKASHALALLDLPDAARQKPALEYRQAAAGGAEAYDALYGGLDHLSFDRDWTVEQLAACGLREATVEDQRVEGYGNAPFRFNAYAWR